MSGGTSRGTEGARGGGGRAVSANVWVEGTSKYTNERMKSSGANARARARAGVCASRLLQSVRGYSATYWGAPEPRVRRTLG